MCRSFVCTSFCPCMHTLSYPRIHVYISLFIGKTHDVSFYFTSGSYKYLYPIYLKLHVHALYHQNECTYYNYCLLVRNECMPACACNVKHAYLKVKKKRQSLFPLTHCSRNVSWILMMWFVFTHPNRAEVIWGAKSHDFFYICTCLNKLSLSPSSLL